MPVTRPPAPNRTRRRRASLAVGGLAIVAATAACVPVQDWPTPDPEPTPTTVDAGRPAPTTPPTTAAPAPAPAPTTTTTAPPPAPTPAPTPSPAPGVVPTEASTGPRSGAPARLGHVEVTGEQTISDAVVDSIVVRAGGRLTLRDVRVNGSVVVLPQVGASIAKLHMSGTAVHAGVTINVIDGGGNLFWGGEVPVDVDVANSWIHHPQGDGSYHTEALAGFGWPRGARFTNTAFVQAGPFNATATATINWHGADTVFDGCHFGWANGTAAYYTVYVEGRNNVVRSSTMEVGLAGYVYPDSSPLASYVGNVDAATGAVI